MDTRSKSHIACLVLEKEATEQGIIVSTPSVDVRYDKILDIKGKQGLQIRLEPPKNNQKKRVVLSKDYLFKDWAEERQE